MFAAIPNVLGSSLLGCSGGLVPFGHAIDVIDPNGVDRSLEFVAVETDVARPNLDVV